ncbi:hypothetical protein IC007_0583 [Sulfuracidifex tepidarius]|uniref:Uncharacterized protein n=1 Tax=Sulfuracidifex tepidarius TaxID=1294262 RepID=A0A510E1V9_9CREN|nr:hypothetical protein IC007_0583 [Sulfuracidifex tepidarius]
MCSSYARCSGGVSSTVSKESGVRVLVTGREVGSLIVNMLIIIHGNPKS